MIPGLVRLGKNSYIFLLLLSDPPNIHECDKLRIPVKNKRVEYRILIQFLLNRKKCIYPVWELEKEDTELPQVPARKSDGSVFSDL